MEQKQSQSGLETRNILLLPPEILLHIFTFLTEAREMVKLRSVSRRLRSISETPSLWRQFVWPYYNLREKDYLYSILNRFGQHIEQLSFPQHVMLTRPVVKSLPHFVAAKRMLGLVDGLHFCNNLTLLSLAVGPDLTSEQLKEVVQNMKCLEVLEIYLPHRGLSSERFVVHTDNTFQILFNLSVKLKEMTIRLEISVRLRMKDLQNWIAQGFRPPKLNVILPEQHLMLKNDLLHGWVQWNAQIPTDHTACLRIFYFLKAPLNLFHDLPVFQLQYGRTATFPFMKASSLGLLGLSKDLLLLTDYTNSSKTVHKAEIDKTSYDTHNIVCSDGNVDRFSLVNELDLSRCDVQCYHLSTIAISCPNLQRLNLRINQHCLSLEGMQMITKHCSKLRGLNLSGIPVSDIQFSIKIWEILSSMKLAYLSINIVFFTRPLTEDDTYKKQFSTLFKQFTTLRALELYCNCRTTRRDYELQRYFPSLQYCRLNLVQHSMCVQDILATCKSLSCFSCHCNVQLQLFLSSLCSNNLQQLCIVSQDNNIDDNFMNTVSAHGKLIHVFFKVHSMTGNGITTLVENSPNLLTFTVSAHELIGFSVGSDLKLLMEKYTHRKLFKFGLLNLLPLNIDPDYLLRSTDLLPLWPPLAGY